MENIENQNALAIANPESGMQLAQPNEESAKFFMDNFRNSYKLARQICNSKFIPDSYRGNIDDCTIAIDMASRMGIPPVMVMQNLYVVKGKPAWSGQACMAFLRNKYKNVKPVYVGEPNTNSWGCYIKAKDSDGDDIVGTIITIDMAKKEGWYSKPGSKWQTMPQQMLAYRAATFFARVFCPEVLMGVLTEGEPEDIANDEAEDVETPNPFANAEVIETEAIVHDADF